MDQDYVIDCSGRKVPIGDKLFSSKCWVGNTTDFLQTNAKHIISKALDWGELAKISITMPIYRSGLSFLPTLKALLAQAWLVPKDVEIILYLNQPPGELDILTVESLGCLRALENDPGQAVLDDKLWNIVKSGSGPKVRVVFEQLEGGLAEVYQRSFITLIARIKRSVDALELKTKSEKVEALDALMNSTIFAIVDDDLDFFDVDSFQEKLLSLRVNKSILMGEVQVTEVSSTFPKWDPILVSLINLFLRFKHELGTSVLTPRAAIVNDLFHLPAINPKLPYADQIWFATAAIGKEKIFVPVKTTIVEESYPSNAAMIARLANFLELDEDCGALQIFENLSSAYSLSGIHYKYNAADIDHLIKVLKERSIERISDYCSKLLSK